MFTCTICHWQFELDDLAVRGTDGRGICLRCYDRTVGNEPHVRTDVIKQIEELQG